jgi:Pyruvate/2-oxoglutarate dehydrogenase complex, dihydrolipoamide acyltransferase (E2) component, and related enzymes
MAHLEMKVPSPGESISEVEIAAWLVADGDYVEKDQAVAEVDSDKATLELPAEESGIITLKAAEGDVVKVGQVVCLIDTSAAKPAGFSSSKSKEDEILLRQLVKKKHPEIQKFKRKKPMQVDFLLLQQLKLWLKNRFQMST